MHTFTSLICLPLTISFSHFLFLSRAGGEILYESLVVNGTLTIPVTAEVKGGGSWESQGNSDPWQIHYSWFTMGL